MENYHTDVLLYTDTCKADSHLEVPDSGDEADAEPKPAKECIWELDLSALEGLEKHDDTRNDGTSELDLTR